MCRGSTLVTAGNAVLAERARAAGGQCVVVPTPVDATAYPARPPQPRSGRVLVWVGMPGNVQYLAALRPVLARLAERVPGLTLRIVSSVFPDWDDVRVERVAWSPAVEKEALVSADIGLMPLADDEFTRGKCAFKLLQYMAAGLPCVASPVGANREVLQDGRSGFLAATPDDWTRALSKLLADGALRESLGACGRERVLARYDAAVVALQMAHLVDAVARGEPSS
jgi:glycosyltransferase involved in cell wall biosynthesis